MGRAQKSDPEAPGVEVRRYRREVRLGNPVLDPRVVDALRGTDTEEAFKGLSDVLRRRREMLHAMATELRRRGLSPSGVSRSAHVYRDLLAQGYQRSSENSRQEVGYFQRRLDLTDESNGFAWEWTFAGYLHERGEIEYSDEKAWEPFDL